MARRRRRHRPRKVGPREPNGQLRSSNKPEVEPISGALWQRLVQYGKRLGVDEPLVSEFGRLNRFGELTRVQTVAALKIAEVYGRFERMRGLRRTCKSASYEVDFGGHSGVDESLLGPAQLREIADREEAVLKSFQLLQSLIPVSLRRWVEELCVEDRAVPSSLYPALRDLFDRLALIWKVEGATKKDYLATPAAPPPTWSARGLPLRSPACPLKTRSRTDRVIVVLNAANKPLSATRTKMAGRNTELTKGIFHA